MEENISLSPRLSTITDMIPVSDTIVDVGSDHGKLSEFCLASNRCRFVIATDIHALPAERTRERLLDYKDRCEVKVTDGLSGVELKEDMTAVIAGMGGLEICKILSNAGESKIPSGMKFVLQPQRSFYEVRSFLCENGFAILDEKIAMEKGHFFYIVILAEYTGKEYTLTDEEKFLGPVILRNRPEYYSEYIAHEKMLFTKKALGDPLSAEILKNWEKYL